MQNVVAVVPERDLVAAQFTRHAVQNAPAQAAAQAAQGFALRDHLFDHSVGVLRFNVKRHPELRQVSGQHLGRKAGLLLV